MQNTKQQVLPVTTLFANTIGSALIHCFSIFVTDLFVDSELQLELADVTNDLNIGGDLTVPAGDITASKWHINCGKHCSKCRSILNGDTNLMATLS